MNAHTTPGKTKRPVSKFRRYWWLAPVLVLVGMVVWLATGPEWSRPRTGKTTDLRLPPGYVSGSTAFAKEYQRFHGRALQDRDAAAQFDQAANHMAAHDYAQAAQLLQQVSRKAPVPSVFNDLGMAYLALNDRENAVNAFREALSRDGDYPAVRQNMERMREMGIDTSVPLTHEVEPNNSLADPNTIAPGRAVDGEIMASMGDIDCYKVTAPPAPRDVLQIEVTPRSRTFTPMAKIFDEERRLLQWIKGGKDLAGQPVSVNLSPAPNSILLMEIEGFADSAGLYTVKVTPLKAFDAYEPNDDIFHAHPVALGQEIAANIMDKSDTDYYSFETVKDGKVKVTIANRSTTLIPALATFQPDLRSSGFGPDVRTPGSGLVHTYDVQANQKYFIQVWSQGDTAGDYTLKIEQ